MPGTGRAVQVRKFSELKGLTVAVVGSAQLMGQTLEKQLGYGMRFIVADSDDHAVSLLRSDQVQAVFTLGGWPLPSVARHKLASGLMLAEYDLEPRPPYLVVKRNYQDLDAFNRNFLAVPNLLVTRPFTRRRPSQQARCNLADAAWATPRRTAGRPLPTGVEGDQGPEQPARRGGLCPPRTVATPRARRRSLSDGRGQSAGAPMTAA